MINITRSSTVPPSLQNPKIQQYLDELSDFKKGTIKEKPNPPINYRNSDVLEEFDKCFFSKCYLTEEKFANSYKMDIDHFIPKSEDESKRYEWSNLFPAEHDANMARPRKTPKGGYLNPCAPNDDVEKEIIYDAGVFGDSPKFSPNDESNTKAVNTSTLLHKIHNGEPNKDSAKKTIHLRRTIQKRFLEISDCIHFWQIAQKGGDKMMISIFEEKLKNLLSRRASFTMLMRSTEIVKQCVPKEFLD